MKKYFLLLMPLLLSAFFLAGCSSESDDGPGAGEPHSLQSITASIEAIGETTRSGYAGEVLSAGFAARVEAGQQMSVSMNGVQANYIYNGKTWVPENDGLVFAQSGNQTISITMSAPSARQDGTLKGLIAADNLVFSGSVEPGNEISGIALSHSKALLEIEAEDVTPDNGIYVNGERAYHYAAGNVYMVMIESGTGDIEVSYAAGGENISHTMGLGGNTLESNWAYRVKITVKGAELDLANSIETVTATIGGIAGLGEVIAEFEKRVEAGQAMTVTVGGKSAVYAWNGSLWMPQTNPLAYPDGLKHDVSVTLESKGAVQDGTEEGYLRADKLVFDAAAHPRVADLTGVTLTRSMGVVNLVFESDSPVSDVKVDATKAVRTGGNTYKVLIAPCSKQLEVSFGVGGGTKSQLTQRVELVAGNTITLDISVTENPTGQIDYALDDLGLPPYIAGSKGNGPAVRVLGGSYKVFAQDPTGTATIKVVQETGALDVYPSNPANRFRVGLHNTISTEQWQFDKPAKILVATDFHGEFDAFVDILMSQNVIDENFNWIYGTNFLVVNGDAVHRGRDETAILWLLYKLEPHAEAAGGRCIYLTANHDDWLLQKSNTGYRNSANRDFASNLKKVEKNVIDSYEDLYEDTYVLGKWLRERNSVVVIGNDAYVHAGIGKRMVNNGFSIPQINQIAKRNIGLSSSKRDTQGKEVFNTSTSSGGTYWLRTMIRKTMPESELTMVLDYYNIDRVICGHTEVDDIAWLYNGRVIGVNVKHKDNWANRYKAVWTRKTSAAMLIEGDDYYMVDYNGNKSLIGTAR